MRPTILITETLDPVPAKWLAERADVVWCKLDDGVALGRELARADGLIVRTYTQVNDALLAQAPKVRVVGRAGVGLDNFDLEACKRRGVRVVYTPDANTQAVVEYVTGLMLTTLRPSRTFDARTTPAQFHALRKTLIGPQLDRLTLGILGFGRIGKRIGQIAHAIGMRILVNDVLPEAALRSAVDYPFEYVDKAALYRGSDVLTIHVDGRPENRNLLDTTALAQLKASCLLINAARGMLINNVALAAWARAVEARGGRAILDVHEPEPPPPDLPSREHAYPLHGLLNVHLYPHLASRTPEALENMSWVVRDVMAVLEGREPKDVAV